MLTYFRTYDGRRLVSGSSDFGGNGSLLTSIGNSKVAAIWGTHYTVQGSSSADFFDLERETRTNGEFEVTCPKINRIFLFDNYLVNITTSDVIQVYKIVETEFVLFSSTKMYSALWEFASILVNDTNKYVLYAVF